MTRQILALLHLRILVPFAFLLGVSLALSSILSTYLGLPPYLNPIPVISPILGFIVGNAYKNWLARNHKTGMKPFMLSTPTLASAFVLSYVAFFIAFALATYGQRVLPSTVIGTTLTGMLMCLPSLLIGFWLPLNPESVLGGTEAQNLDLRMKELLLRFFDSNEFLSTLSNALPKGDKDHEYGFDYVPYLLKSIAERRERFQRSARFFLYSTLSMGVLFVFILVGLGYILVNESAAGTPRRIEQLFDTNKEILQTLTSLKLSEQQAKNIIANIVNCTREAKAQGVVFQPILSEDALKHEIRMSLASGSPTEQLATLLGSIERTAQTMQSQHNQFGVRLQNSMVNLEELIGSNAATLSPIQSSVERLQALLPSIETKLNSGESRITELLKRLTLGIVVASFFLAVLRYLAMVYRHHLDEVIKAERDDLAVRRFYVAFRCAGQDTDLQRSVLQEFVKLGYGSGALNEKPENEIQTNQAILDVLSEIIKKKI